MSRRPLLPRQAGILRMMAEGAVVADRDDSRGTRLQVLDAGGAELHLRVHADDWQVLQMRRLVERLQSGPSGESRYRITPAGHSALEETVEGITTAEKLRRLTLFAARNLHLPDDGEARLWIDAEGEILVDLQGLDPGGSFRYLARVTLALGTVLEVHLAAEDAGE